MKRKKKGLDCPKGQCIKKWQRSLQGNKILSHKGTFHIFPQNYLQIQKIKYGFASNHFVRWQRSNKMIKVGRLNEITKRFRQTKQESELRIFPINISLAACSDIFKISTSCLPASWTSKSLETSPPLGSIQLRS